MEIIIILALLALYIYLGLKKPGVALITSPFLAGTLIVTGAVEENTFVIASAPVIFIVTLITVLLSKQEPDSENWPQICAKWFFIICGILFLLLIILVVNFDGYCAV